MTQDAAGVQAPMQESLGDASIPEESQIATLGRRAIALGLSIRSADHGIVARAKTARNDIQYFDVARPRALDVGRRVCDITIIPLGGNISEVFVATARVPKPLL